MKKICFATLAIIAFVLFGENLFSQGVAINTDGTTANPSAMLDVKSTNAGILVPRLTLDQRGAISNPATGLLIFQTDNTPGFYYNTGTPAVPSWIKLSIPTDNFDDADADATNELQTISISGHDITLSDGGGTVTVPDNNTTYSAGTGLTLTGTVFTPTFGTTVGTVSQGNHTHDASHVITGEFDRARVRRMISYDSRATNSNPDTYEPALQTDFKQNTTDGLSDGGTYHGVMSYRPYGSTTDFSGGPMHQVGFTQNGNLWLRTSTGTTTWSAWKKLLSSSDIGTISGTTNYVSKFTSANALGNSQIFDNGSNIGIGTAAPAAGMHMYQDRYTLYGPNSAWGAYLQVGGNGRVTTNASVAATNGNLHIDARDGAYATYINYYSQNNTYINGLGGNVGIGNTGPTYKLDVTGDIRSTNKIWANANGASYFRGGDDAELWDVNVGNTLGVYGVQNPAVATIRLGSGASDISGSGGNIGIGTTTPMAKLDVAGTAKANSFSQNNNGLRITSPDGASYVTATSSVTGAIKITLPQYRSSTMMRMTIKIYQYATDQSYTIELGGYNYVSGGWYNTFANVTSTSGASLNVRFGYDGTPNNCIWIGETSSTWSYPQVFVTDFQAGYSNYTTDQWDNGWAISFETSLNTVETTANTNFISGNGYIKNQYSGAQTANQWISGETRTGGWFRSSAGGTGWYSEPYGAGIYSTTTGEVATYNGSYLRISGAANTSGNLRFDAANPYISASSYFIAPGGAYFNGGTVYCESAIQARGGIQDDTHANLNILGGTSGASYFSGPISGMSGSYPANNMIRLTPNLHLNSLAGYAVILNWDNGTSGNTQTLRIGNGAGTDVFNVWANGNTSIGTTPSTSYMLYSYYNQLTGNGDGQASIYGYRTRDSQNDGTGYSAFSSNSAISSYNFWGDLYTFGTSGFCYNDYTRTGGVLGAQSGGAYWGSLGYKNSASATYGVYGSSGYASGGGFLASNGQLVGVGGGFYGDLMGGWSRGELMGFTTSGEMYALYNDGNSYTEGYSADIVKTDDGRKAAYSVTSTELKVYDDGSYEINGNEIFVSFDKDFASMINPTQNPTITVSPVGGWAPLYIKEIRQDGFVVANDNYNGNNVKFSWIAVAERIDSENAELPKDIADDKFNENLKGFMFNENITNRNATPIRWDGSTLRFDAIPEKPIDEAAKKAEEERMKNQ